MFQQTRRLTGRRLNRQTLSNRYTARRVDADKRSRQIEYETSIHKILEKYRHLIESNEPLTREQYYKIFRHYHKHVRESIVRSVKWTPNMTWNKYLTAIAATIGIVLAASAVAAAASSVAAAQSSSSYAQAPMYTPPVSSQSLMNPTPVSNVSMKPNRKQELYEFQYSKPYKAPRQQESQPQNSKGWLDWLALPGAAASPTNAPNANVNGVEISTAVIRELVNNKEKLNNAIMEYDILRKKLTQTKAILADKCVSAKVANREAVCKNNKVDNLDLNNLEGKVTEAFIAVEKARELVKASYNNLAIVIIDEIVKESNISKDQQPVFKKEVADIMFMDRNQLLQRQTARERAIHSIATPELKMEEEVKVRAIKAVLNKNVKERMRKLEKSAIKHKLKFFNLSKGEALLGLDPSGDVEVMVDIAKIANLTMKIYNLTYDEQAYYVRYKAELVKHSTLANKKAEAAAKNVTIMKGKSDAAAAEAAINQNKSDAAAAAVIVANNDVVNKETALSEADAIVKDVSNKFYTKYGIKTRKELFEVPPDNVELIHLLAINKKADDAKDVYEASKAAAKTAEATAKTAKAAAEVSKAAAEASKAAADAAEIAEATAKAEADAAKAAIDKPVDLEKVPESNIEKIAQNYRRMVIEAEQKLKEEKDRQREKAEAEARKWDYLLVPAAIIGHVYAASRRGQREEKEFRELCENEVHRIEQLQNPINEYMHKLLDFAERLPTLESDITIENCRQIKILSREFLNVANRINVSITRFIDGSRLHVTLPSDRYYNDLRQRSNHIYRTNSVTKNTCLQIINRMNDINTRIQQNGLCPPLEPQLEPQVNEEENDGLPLGHMGGRKSLRKGGRRTKKRNPKKIRSTCKRHPRR